jgi:nitrate/nitrite transport system ATP-binding protein
MITHDVDESIYLADRIVLMTNGPEAKVAEIVENPLPRPRDSTIVSDPEFGRLSGELWESLREESAVEGAEGAESGARGEELVEEGRAMGFGCAQQVLDGVRTRGCSGWAG